MSKRSRMLPDLSRRRLAAALKAFQPLMSAIRRASSLPSAGETAPERVMRRCTARTCALPRTLRFSCSRSRTRCCTRYVASIIRTCDWAARSRSLISPSKMGS